MVAGGASPAQRAALRGKLLVGTPFYGYDNTEALLGPRFVDVLTRGSSAAQLQYDVTAKEHYVKGKAWDGVPHTAFYPSPLSLSLRADLGAASFGGVAIWELGQGLDWLFDVL